MTILKRLEKKQKKIEKEMESIDSYARWEANQEYPAESPDWKRYDLLERELKDIVFQINDINDEHTLDEILRYNDIFTKKDFDHKKNDERFHFEIYKAIRFALP